MATTNQAASRTEFDGRLVDIRAGSAVTRGEGTSSARPSVVAAATADIQVDYDGFSPAAQAAFEAAVQVWESTIVSDEVIRIYASWEPLGSGVLGAAGPTGFYLGADGYVYPAAVEEARCSCDLDSSYEIEAYFNSTFSDWYYGTDGNTPSSKYDLFTVVMHEIGHGLGLLSSFEVVGNYGYWGFTNNGRDYYPLRWDAYEWNKASGGKALTSYAPNGSQALKSQLTDGSVYLGGPNVVDTIGGRARLYAPNPWNSGSSNSHLNESTYGAGSADGLMTPQLGRGEAHHSASPLTRAILRDVGWSTSDTTPSDGPPNDDFADASQVAILPFEDAFVDNTNATFEAEESDPSCRSLDATVWYRIQPTSNYQIRVRVFAQSSVDPVVAVYQGTSLGSLTEMACVDAANSAGTETAYANLTSGMTYYIQVGGYYNSNTTGEFTVKVRRETAPSQGPANDNFANAASAALGSVSNATTTAATFESGEPAPSCGPTIGKTVWYRYTPSTTRTIIANTAGSSFDTILAVYTGSAFSLTKVKCNDDAANRTSKVKFQVVAGTTYYFQVGGYQSASGSLVFRLKSP